MLHSFFALLLMLGAARAAPSHRDPRDETPIEDRLAAIDPTLATQFHDATAALDAGRLKEARAGFNAVLARVPEHAASLRRLSYVDRSEHEVVDAIALARRALKAEPSADSEEALAGALLESRTPESLEDARALAERAHAEKPSERTAVLRAQIALEQRRPDSLKAAVDDLKRFAPDSVATNYFAALNSLLHDDQTEADRFLTRAERAGLPAQVAQQLREQGGINHALQMWFYAKVAAVALGLWLIGLVGVFLFGRLLSHWALVAIERSAGSDDLRRRTTRLRRIYATTIGAAAAYYYVSIPVLVVLVLGIAGGLIYGSFMAGHVPIKLVVLVGFGALASAWAMVKSLLTKPPVEKPPGRAISEADAPGLWAMLRDVAERVGTRAVDDAYLTPGTDVAVAEWGTMKERLGDRGHRYLILGAGVLPGFTQGDLRAVLAHEYGHFSNRDTAGGRLAAAVQTSLWRALVGVAQSGGLLIINPAWHFLRVFHGLFLRITLGASRLQEVMADHFAALAYGPRAFADGLTHVIRRGVEFKRDSDGLIKQAEIDRRGLVSLYAKPPEQEGDPQALEAEIAKIMADKGSPYDSHPPPAQRIAWISRLPEITRDAMTDAPAWDLFVDRAALEAAMTTRVNERLEDAGVIAPLEPGPLSLG